MTTYESVLNATFYEISIELFCGDDQTAANRFNVYMRGNCKKSFVSCLQR